MHTDDEKIPVLISGSLKSQKHLFVHSIHHTISSYGPSSSCQPLLCRSKSVAAPYRTSQAQPCETGMFWKRTACVEDKNEFSGRCCVCGRALKHHQKPIGPLFDWTDAALLIMNSRPEQQQTTLCWRPARGSQSALVKLVTAEKLFCRRTVQFVKTCANRGRCRELLSAPSECCRSCLSGSCLYQHAAVGWY